MTQLLLAQPGQPRDRIREGNARVDERLEGVDYLELADAHSAHFADAVARGRKPRRLEVEDDELRVLERRIRPRPRQ